LLFTSLVRNSVKTYFFLLHYWLVFINRWLAAGSMACQCM